MWLLIVTIAYFLNAIAAVVDKFLISKKIPNPAVYTFAIVTLGLLGLILAPWGFGWIGLLTFLITLVSGLTFAFALYALFKALTFQETSRITPFIGGLSPIFVLFFSFWFVQERLGQSEIIAFILIVLGTILISLNLQKKKTSRGGWGWAFFSALLFGLSYASSKYVFSEAGFVNGFVWLRLTTFLGGVLLLLSAANRQAIIQNFKNPETKTGGLFLFGQVAGALSFVLINYAISLASVTLVNALQGLQYVFLLIMILILAKWHPQVLEEKMRGRILIQKIIAIVLIVFGLAFLV